MGVQCLRARSCDLDHLTWGPRSDRACVAPASGQAGEEAAGKAWGAGRAPHSPAGMQRGRHRPVSSDLPHPGCPAAGDPALPAFQWHMLPSPACLRGQMGTGGQVRLGTSFGDSPWSLRPTTRHPDSSQAPHPGMSWGAGLPQRPAGRPMPSLGPSPRGSAGLGTRDQRHHHLTEVQSTRHV